MDPKALVFAILILAAVAGWAIWYLVDRSRRGGYDLEVHLRRVEAKVAALQHDFHASGLDDYPGGPLTTDDNADGNERPL